MGFKLPSAGVTPAPSEKREMLRTTFRSQVLCKPASDFPPTNFLTGTKSRIFFLSLGAGLSPAEGGVEPTAGPTFNKRKRGPAAGPVYLTLSVLARSSPAGRMRSPVRTESVLR